MSASDSHEAQVDRQFGARAADYVASAVHSAGADLDALAALCRDLPHANVLDLGCGGGHVAYAVAPLVRAVPPSTCRRRCSTRWPWKPPAAA